MPEISALNPDFPDRVVFDTGNSHDNFSISELPVTLGIIITDHPDDTDLIRNYIKQTRNTVWQEVAYDPTNPRHNRLLLVQPGQGPVITGIQDSSSYSRQPLVADNPLAAAIIDGTLTTAQTGQAIAAAEAQLAQPNLAITADLASLLKSK